jgi:hypothetical protein
MFSRVKINSVRVKTLLQEQSQLNNSPVCTLQFYDFISKKTKRDNIQMTTISIIKVN